jgi:hypothetical protein
MTDHRSTGPSTTVATGSRDTVRSRRSVLTAGLAAVGLTVADAIGRPAAVGAGNSPVYLGAENTEQSTTVLTNTSPGQGGLWGRNEPGTTSHAGVGLRGDTNGIGTNTNQPAAGVWGNVGGTDSSSKAVGVLGRTSAPSEASAGVLGLATGAANTAAGVRGKAVAGAGVHGTSTDGNGVYGASNHTDGVAGVTSKAGKAGVRGEGVDDYRTFGVVGVSPREAGVVGFAGNGTPPTASPVDYPVGVYGFAELIADGTGVGVFGATTKGVAVWASGQDGIGILAASRIVAGVFNAVVPTATCIQANNGAIGVDSNVTSGDALRGTATSGRALHTSGRLAFDRVSGVASVPPGASKVVVDPGVTVSASSFVLLTSKVNLGSRGLWFTVDAANDKFTIRISSPYSSTAEAPIAWLLVG